MNQPLLSRYLNFIATVTLIVSFCFYCISEFSSYKKLAAQKKEEDLSFASLADHLFSSLNSTGEIVLLKEKIPAYSTVGYYSDLPYGNEYMMYCVLQNLLAPILIERDQGEKYQQTIVFTKKDPREILALLHRSSLHHVGTSLFLVGE